MSVALHPEDRRFAMADLEEDFARCMARSGQLAATRWYRAQVLRSLAPCLCRRVRLARVRLPNTPFHGLVQDTRLAWRAARKRPGMTLVAILTLALGIGAVTAVFSAVNGVLLQPLPHPDASQLVILWETDRRVDPPATRVNVSPANYADWQSVNRVFEGLAAYSIGQATATGLAEPQMVTRAWVTSGFHPLLRVQPHLGRLFVAGDDSDAAPDIVVLAHDFWRGRYGGERDVIGKTMTLNGASYTIVGVLERDADFLDRGVEVWTPYRMSPAERDDRGTHSLNVLARMRTGIALADAQAEMDQIADHLRRQYPEWMSGYGVNVVPLRDELVGRVRPALLVLLGGVAIVLMIATVNVANLLLVRASERRRELAVQVALGAGRGRMLRRALTESLTITTIGGALGLLLAKFATDALLGLAPEGLPRAEHIAVDLRVAGFAVGLALGTGLAFGLLPGLHNFKTQLCDALKQGGRAATGTRQQRLRQTLVVAEVALSMVLLISAGLLTRSFWQLTAVESGFSPEGVLTAKVRLPSTDYPDNTSMTRFYEDLLRDLHALPQVKSAALTRFLPLSDGPWTFALESDGLTQPMPDENRRHAYHPVSTEYFHTAGMRLIRGRDFTTADNEDAQPVLIINEAMERLLWPGGDGIGKRIRFDIDAADAPWRTIVGVVSDVRHDAIHQDPRPAVYGPQAQAFSFMSNRMRLVVRTSGEPLRMAPAIRQIVQRLDPNLPVFDIRTMSQILSDSVAQPRYSMLLIGSLAGVAALLALIGVYGVVSYAVRQRTPELGVRLALGADRGSMVRLVLREGMSLASVGMAVGVAGALVAGRVLDSLLFGIQSTDLLTYVGVALLLSVATVIACSIPAYRAGRLDPAAVMRDQ